MDAEVSALEFGSRLGSWLALAFFILIFLMLAVACWREMRRRAPRQRQAARAVAGVIFIVPVALIYASSLNGFYEAEIRSDRLILRYLFPTEYEVPLGDVATVRASPAFKRRWRLYLVTANGVRYESATADRDVVSAAVERLRQSVQNYK